MTQEENNELTKIILDKYKEALMEIQDIAGNINEQDCCNINEELAVQQDESLIKIYFITKNCLE